MKIQSYIGLVLAAFIFTAVFGLYAPMGHAGHGANSCPFALGSFSVCGLPLQHIDHWTASVTATLIFSELLFLITLFILVGYIDPSTFRDPQFERYRLRDKLSARPTLLEELFARGILHRKEPHVSPRLISNY